MGRSLCARMADTRSAVVFRSCLRMFNLLWPNFQEQVTGELYVQPCLVSGNGSEGLVVHVVVDTVFAILQPTQFNRSLPVLRVEGVIHGLVAADNVRLRQVKADIVKLAQILATG